MDLKAEWFDQAVDITEKVSCGAASDAPADPRQHTDIARDLKVEIGAEQRSNLVVVGTRAHAGEEFLCNAGGFFEAHEIPSWRGVNPRFENRRFPQSK